MTAWNYTHSASETEVYGGSKYTSGIYNVLTGDVTIDLGEKSNFAWVYGGGYNSGVKGDITINLEAAPDGTEHAENNVGHIVGGGYASNEGPANGRYSGTVSGDITLNLKNGQFNGLEGGSSCTKYFDGVKSGYYGYIDGDITINFGDEDYDADSSMVQMTTSNNLYGGSHYSTIAGNVTVTFENGTNLAFSGEDGVIGFYGLGMNSSVLGKITLTQNGGKIDSIFGMNLMSVNSDGDTVVGDRSWPTDNNYLTTEDAIVININGGEVGQVAWFPTKAQSVSATKNLKFTVYGNIIITVDNDASVGTVWISTPTAWSYGDGWGALPNNCLTQSYVRGAKGVELHVKGGNWQNSVSVYAQPTNRIYGGQRIYFENDEPVSLYRIYNANATQNRQYQPEGNQADIIVNNAAPVQLKNYRYDTNKYVGNYWGALYDCGDLDIQSGTLILPGQNKILGDFHIGENGTLVTNGTISNINENGFLNVEGETSGTGDLLVVESSALKNGDTGWLNCESMTEQLPAVGEVYLRSQTTTETALGNTDATLLDLANSPNQGRYVEYTTNSTATTSYARAWRIAQGEVTEVTWYYEVYYQNSDGTFTKWKADQGGKAEEAATVSITHDQFDGTDLGWGEKLGTHYVFDEKNPNNRLSATASEATKDNPLKIYYKCAPHTVTYEYDNTAPVGATPPQQETHYYSKEVTPTTPAEVSGYTFNGWTVKSPSGVTIENGVLKMPNEDVVLVGSWKKAEAAKHSVTFLPGEHGALEGTTAFQVIAGQTMQSSSYTVPTVREDNDYDFTGWLGDDGKIYTSSDILNLFIDQDRTFTAQYEKDTDGGAHHPEVDPDDDDDEPEDEPEEMIDEDVPLAETPWLNTKDHYAYIIGYAEDGTVRPQANITRAEVATIFFRLLTDDARDQFWSTSNNFSDVTPDAWYNNAVSTMVNAGIIQGYEDGTFRPNANITRAEFAAIASRFMSSGYDVKEDLFSDIADHWARENINDAAMTKWINGYPDGTFRPDQAITRAEAVTLVNNVLQRKPDADHMFDTMIKWSDNMDTSAWYYEAIQEATNSHDYDLFEGAEYETWTALLKNRDWAALEKDWTNAHRIGGEGA